MTNHNLVMESWTHRYSLKNKKTDLFNYNTEIYFYVHHVWKMEVFDRQIIAVLED